MLLMLVSARALIEGRFATFLSARGRGLTRRVISALRVLAATALRELAPRIWGNDGQRGEIWPTMGVSVGHDWVSTPNDGELSGRR